MKGFKTFLAGLAALVLISGVVLTGCEQPTESTVSGKKLTVTTAGGSSTVAKGGSLIFSVAAADPDTPAPEVEWSVDGGKSKLTKINTVGILTVGNDETSDGTIILTITATAADGSSGSAKVTVRNFMLEIANPPPTIGKGQTKTFSASGGSVKWTVTGGSAGTSIASDGTLTVGPREAAKTLTIVASSDADLSITASVKVAVVDVLTVKSDNMVAQGAKLQFSVESTADAVPTDLVWAVSAVSPAVLMSGTDIDKASGLLAVSVSQTLGDELIITTASAADTSFIIVPKTVTVTKTSASSGPTVLQVTGTGPGVAQGKSMVFTVTTLSGTPATAVASWDDVTNKDDGSTVGGAIFSSTTALKNTLEVGPNVPVGTVLVVKVTPTSGDPISTEVLVTAPSIPLNLTITGVLNSGSTGASYVDSTHIYTFNASNDTKIDFTAKVGSLAPPDVAWTVNGGITGTAFASMDNGTLTIKNGDQGPLVITAVWLTDLNKMATITITKLP